MTRVDLRDAREPFATYVRRARRSPVIITEAGKAPVVILPLSPEEWEDFGVGTHPGFLALLRRSRARAKPGTGTPLADLERDFLTKPARRARASTERQPK